MACIHVLGTGVSTRLVQILEVLGLILTGDGLVISESTPECLVGKI